MSYKKYTDEQIQWVRDNIDNYYYKDLVKEFNLKFNTKITLSNIRHIRQQNNISKTKMFTSTAPINNRKIFEHHINWLRLYAPTHKSDDITKEFNKKFGFSFSVKYIRDTLVKKNIPFLVRDKNNNLSRRIITKEHIEWIKENKDRYNKKGLRNTFYNEFISTFKINIKKCTFDKLLSNHSLDNLNYEKIHVYTKEENEWIKNNYQKYIDEQNVFLPNKFIQDYNNNFNGSMTLPKLWRRFKSLGISKPKSYSGYERFPIGHEYTSSDGTVYVKISNEVGIKDKNPFFIHYKKKANILYEQYHNVVLNEKEQIVIHLDNNKSNFKKDNLYLINRKAFIIYNNTHYKNQSLETKLNALKVCEIKQLIKEIE